MSKKELSNEIKKISVKINEEHKREVLELVLEKFEGRFSVRQKRKRLGKFLFIQIYKKMLGSIVLQSTVLVFMLVVLQRLYIDKGYLLTKHFTATLSAFSVIIAMFSMPLLGRAEKYNMSELESITFISRKKITFIHLAIILLDNILFIGIGIFLFKYTIATGVSYSIWHIILPYLIAASGCIIMQRISTYNLAFNYIVYTVALICTVVGISYVFPDIYIEDYYSIWMFLCLIIGVGLIYRICGALSERSNYI